MLVCVCMREREREGEIGRLFEMGEKKGEREGEERWRLGGR